MYSVFPSSGVHRVQCEKQLGRGRSMSTGWVLAQVKATCMKEFRVYSAYPNSSRISEWSHEVRRSPSWSCVGCGPLGGVPKKYILQMQFLRNGLGNPIELPNCNPPLSRRSLSPDLARPSSRVWNPELPK